jgi:hypothetical protein
MAGTSKTAVAPPKQLANPPIAKPPEVPNSPPKPSSPVPPHVTPGPQASPPPNLPVKPLREQCLALLNIDLTTPVSGDLIRRQWNLLTKRCDLNKAATLGPKYVKMVDADLAALRKAAEFLLGPMGEKLEIEPQRPPQDLRHNPDLDDVFGI